MEESRKSKRWDTLSHHGPFFPTSKIGVIRVKANTRCDGMLMNDDIQMSSNAAIVVKKLNHTLQREGQTSGERKQYTDRFWKTWWKIFIPACKNPRLESRSNHSDQGLTPNSMKSLLNFDMASNDKKSEEKARKHQFAIVNGVAVKVANFVMEPPGIFLGRGKKHPFGGSVKRAIKSSDVTINIGRHETVPRPSDGGNWASVVHQQHSAWLASWKDPTNGKTKYMRLAIQETEDQEKFNIAKLVMKALPFTRAKLSSDLAKIMLDIKSASMNDLQTICCFLLMDRFALRVGGDRSGRVFGVTTLRMKHIRLQNTKNFPRLVELSFVGKDSMICSSIGHVTKQLFEGMKFLCERKGGSSESDVFDRVNERIMNNFIMLHLPSGSTAKSVRTARACETYENVLLDEELVGKNSKGESVRHRFVERIAVATVALLCNHHRNPNNLDAVDTESALLSWKHSVISNKTSIADQRLAQKQAVINLNLSTSLASYIDPRITRAFEARHSLVAGSCSSPLLQAKFAWSLGTPSKFRFCSQNSLKM